MAIVGVGTDIIEIERIKKAAGRASFVSKVFTEKEISLCRQKPDFYAALAIRFAAKEAVVKALGTGLRGCTWQDIEVLSSSTGQPFVLLYGGAKDIAAGRGITSILVSMSHSRENAVAFCVAEGGEETDEACNSGRNALAGPDSN
ncbi:holo-ACP synthase [Candidatus Formimonas warabiya]|uniref:Holo-[acyl-carrier-protein] synthase n=1 Tax=Formimonas warabiya TaxID=1761012 RepID=A0A3G1KSY8_FORW1|nr:holo-ACP synthase [Candidatus Formimonas warabiya]ATW25578.1 holo-[acyl-carrier-protein] synthase [Candidatus Formimonas warabiya]